MRRSASFPAASAYSSPPARSASQPPGRRVEPLGGPGERGRRRLVAGDEQRHQLVADLRVGERLALLRPRGEQEREDVLARLCTAIRDLLEQELVDGAQPRLVEAELLDPLGPRRDHGEHRRAAHDPVHHLRQAGAELVQPRAPLDAEDDAQHDVERDRLQPRRERDPVPARPARDVLARDLGDEVVVAGHARAVERRQHQLALAQVLRAVEQEHGRAAEERAQDHVRLACVQERRVALEHLAHVVGVREHDPRRLRPDLDGEHVAVARVGLCHERAGPRHPRGGLRRARHARSGRKPHGRDPTPCAFG